MAVNTRLARLRRLRCPQQMNWVRLSESEQWRRCRYFLRSSLVGALTLLVDTCEVWDDDGHRQSNDEHTAQWAHAADELADDRVRHHVTVAAPQPYIHASFTVHVYLPLYFAFRSKWKKEKWSHFPFSAKIENEKWTYTIMELLLPSSKRLQTRGRLNSRFSFGFATACGEFLTYRQY